MCTSKDKIKVELYLTPEEIIELGKFLKKKSAVVVATTTGGEGNSGGNG